MAIYDRHEWLAGRVESAIDPDRPIIDPHHHLWDRDDSRYLAQELRTDARSSHNVTHTVFVECSAAYDPVICSPVADETMAPVGETRFVAEQAAEALRLGGPEIAGIVGHVDLTMGERVAEVLVEHEARGAGLFRGVRHGTNWSPHPDVKNGHHQPGPHLLANPDFRAGVAQLGDAGYTFDAWLYFDQMQELAELAEAIPQCQIVLDHLGGPLGIGPHASQPVEMAAAWRSGIEAVAACPNVALKVGGLGMEHYFGTPWADQPRPPSSDEVAAYWNDMVHFAIDTFGPPRCMFESNFPVDRQTLPYTVVWNVFEILAERYTPAEQHDLFWATANRVYRLGARPGARPV